MLSFNNDFIGYDSNKDANKFSGSDSENVYNINLQSKPDNWYYKNEPITYFYNEYGHRSKNLSEIDLDNYILCLGCSHTEGIGNYERDTYAHQTAQLLNCDYYNMGIGGCGLDIMMHNLTTWMLKVEKLPKLIIWQWTAPFRYVTVKDTDTVEIRTHGLWNDEKEVVDFIAVGDRNKFFSSRAGLMKKYLNLLSKTKNIPIIQVSLQDKDASDEIFYQRHDNARDGKHYGALSNKTLSVLIADKYNYELNNI